MTKKRRLVSPGFSQKFLKIGFDGRSSSLTGIGSGGVISHCSNKGRNAACPPWRSQNGFHRVACVKFCKLGPASPLGFKRRRDASPPFSAPLERTYSSTGWPRSSFRGFQWPVRGSIEDNCPGWGRSARRESGVNQVPLDTTLVEPQNEPFRLNEYQGIVRAEVADTDNASGWPSCPVNRSDPDDVPPGAPL